MLLENATKHPWSYTWREGTWDFLVDKIRAVFSILYTDSAPMSILADMVLQVSILSNIENLPTSLTKGHPSSSQTKHTVYSGWSSLFNFEFKNWPLLPEILSLPKTDTCDEGRGEVQYRFYWLKEH